MKKIITTLLITICSCALIFTGCGSNNKSTDTKTETTAKTYNYSDMYKTAKTQLENSILDDETYSALSETLKFYEKKDLTSLSKKDAKKIKSTCTEISEYYEASAQSIQDTLSQLGSVYPTDESFYDDNFKTNTSTMFIDLNSLMTEGKYKEAAVKLNEITSTYTAYVESKGEVVIADVSVTAEKTTKTKDQIVAKKAVSGNSGNTKSSNNTTSNSNNTASNNSSVSTGPNSNNTNNTTGNTSSNTNTSKPGSTSSNTNKSNTTTNNSSNKNNNNSNSSNSNQNTFEAKTYLFGPDVDGSGTNQAYCTSQAEYNAAYKIYMQHVNAYGEEQKRQQEEQKRQQEEADAEAAAFAYVSGANVAYQKWCESPECDATISFDTWLDTHGYNSSLYHQYCNKYGW